MKAVKVAVNYMGRWLELFVIKHCRLSELSLGVKRGIGENNWVRVGEVSYEGMGYDVKARESINIFFFLFH